MAFDILSEIPQLADAIADGEGPSGVFEIESGLTGRMLEAHGTLPKLSSFDRRENCAIPT